MPDLSERVLRLRNATVYGFMVKHGYTGTEEDFYQLLLHGGSGFNVYSITDAVLNLDNIPLNSAGNVRLSSSINPFGQTVYSTPYICFGMLPESSGFSRVLIIINSSNNKLYYSVRVSPGNWTNFEQIGEGGGSDLPPVTPSDNGKFLGVVNGAYGLISVVDVSQEGQ